MKNYLEKRTLTISAKSLLATLVSLAHLDIFYPFILCYPCIHVYSALLELRTYQFIWGSAATSQFNELFTLQKKGDSYY